MARNENPPFPRGGTFFGGATPDTTSGAQLEGTEWEFEDEDFSTGTIGAVATRSNRRVRVRVVRNLSGSTLLPKLCAALKLDGTTSAVYTGQISGYSSAAVKGYPIDEFLPSTGVVANDLFYIVVDGCAKVKTAASGTTTVAVGGVAVSASGGLLVAQDTTTSGANLFNQIQNAIGRAATGVAAASTEFVIDVNGSCH